MMAPTYDALIQSVIPYMCTYTFTLLARCDEEYYEPFVMHQHTCMYTLCTLRQCNDRFCTKEIVYRILNVC